MPTFLQNSYDANKSLPLIIPFATDAYGSGPNSDVNETPNYSLDIDLTEKIGIILDFAYIEISGATGTDEIIIKLFRKINATWTGREKPIDEAQYPNPGVAAGENIESYVIDTNIYDPGHYRVSVVSTGGTNPFDAKLSGYKWRFEGVDV